MSPDTPHNAHEPDWDNAGRIHDWRNKISDEVQAMWSSFTPEQQAALARQADEQASAEDWD